MARFSQAHNPDGGVPPARTVRNPDGGLPVAALYALDNQGRVLAIGGPPQPGEFALLAPGAIVVDAATGVAYTNGGTATAPTWTPMASGPTILASYDGTTQGQADALNATFGGVTPFSPSPDGLTVTLATDAATGTGNAQAQLNLPTTTTTPASGIYSLRVAATWALTAGDLGAAGSLHDTLYVNNDVDFLTFANALLAFGADATGLANQSTVVLSDPSDTWVEVPYTPSAAPATVVEELVYDASGAQPVATRYRNGVPLGTATDASGLPLDPGAGWWHAAPFLAFHLAAVGADAQATTATVTITVHRISVADGYQGV